MSGDPRPDDSPYTAADYATAALVSIDTQRDVLDGGRLEIAGTSAALPAMAALARAFREAGRPIVHVVRLYERDGANVDLCRRHLVERGARMLLAGDPGSDLAGELLPAGAEDTRLDAPLLIGGGMQSLAPGEWAMYKPRWGAFYGTPLEEHLRGGGVSTLVFCGCNFPNCPRTSIYEASERDFRVVLARDAISGLYERGEHELTGIGVAVLDSSEIVAALAARPREVSA
jgi:nicotinamidase-related amidase